MPRQLSTVKDVEQFIDKLKYKNSYKERILNDIEAVGSSTILMFDEKMVEDPKMAKLKVFWCFLIIVMKWGNTTFTFNSSKTSWGRGTYYADFRYLKKARP